MLSLFSYVGQLFGCDISHGLRGGMIICIDVCLLDAGIANIIIIMLVKMVLLMVVLVLLVLFVFQELLLLVVSDITHL